jgi:hypothetical protein
MHQQVSGIRMVLVKVVPIRLIERVQRVVDQGAESDCRSRPRLISISVREAGRDRCASSLTKVQGASWMRALGTAGTVMRADHEQQAIRQDDHDGRYREHSFPEAEVRPTFRRSAR